MLKYSKLLLLTSIFLQLAAVLSLWAAPATFVRPGTILYDDSNNAYRIVNLISAQKALVESWDGSKWVTGTHYEMSLEEAASGDAPSSCGISVGDIVVMSDGTRREVLAITPSGLLVAAAWNGTSWFGPRMRLVAWSTPSESVKKFGDVAIGDVIFDKTGNAWKVFALSRSGRAYVKGWGGTDYDTGQGLIDITPSTPRMRHPPVNGIAIGDVVLDNQKIEFKVMGIAPNGDLAVAGWNGNAWWGGRGILNAYGLPGRPKDKPVAPIDKTDRLDEMHDARSPLAAVYSRVDAISSRLSDERKSKIRAKSSEAFAYDNPLLEIPRFVDAQEYEAVLKPGILQRGRALLMLLEDYYSGKKRFSKEGILPEAVLNKILQRHGEIGFNLNPDGIYFPYGPDLAKDQNGAWRVVEDSVGMLGGLGDLVTASKTLFKLVPEYKAVIKPPNPLEFYEELARTFRAAANPHDGKIVAYLAQTSGDHENTRMKRIFEKYGITVLDNKSDRGIRFENGKAFLRTHSSGREEPIGYLYLNMEHDYLDRDHPVIFRKKLLEMVRKFINEDHNPRLNGQRAVASAFMADSDPQTGLPRQFEEFIAWARAEGFYEHVKRAQYSDVLPGLVEVLEKGLLPTNYSPGLDFLNDKEFYFYVERLIRFYLNEKPILRSITSRPFLAEGTKELDAGFLGTVIKNQSSWVIKHVDGRGGNGVVVGARVSAEEFKNVLSEVKLHPESYIAQEFIALSTVDGQHIGDMRIHSIISSAHPPVISKFPWGRVIHRNRNGKVNLSGEGMEQVVIVQEQPSASSTCERIWLSFANKLLSRK